MWKAVLILFVTTSTQPVSLLISEFPQAFMKPADCMEFLDTHRDGIMDYVNGLWDAKSKNLIGLSHKITCLQDMSGEAV